MSQKLKRQLQNTKKTQASSAIGHIFLVITTGWVVELEALLEVQLVLLYAEVNGVNLLLHGRDGLMHG
jgi:hypothetical protein